MREATMATAPRSWARTYLPALLVLVCSLTLTFLIWSISEDREDARLIHQFDHASSTIQAELVDSMNEHSVILRGAAGFLYGSDAVTRDEWEAYVTALEFQQHFPGIQGISYNAVVHNQSEKDATLDLMRAGDFPDFAIRPDGPRDVYVPVLFLEPLDDRNRQAIGFDIYSEPLRRAAIDQAAQSGKMTMTAKITLVQESVNGADEQTQAGVLVVLPIFDAAERQGVGLANVTGFVVSVFRMGDLVASVMAKQQQNESKGILVSLYDATTPEPSALMFGGQQSDLAGAPQYQRTFPLFGRAWTVVMEPSSSYQYDRNPMPKFIAMFGVVGSLFVSLLLLSQAYRLNQIAIAKNIAEAHQEHIQMLMHEVNHRSKNLLTLVRSIARLTADEPARPFLRQFSTRIEGLAHSQDLLVRNHWGGIELGELIRSQLSHFSDPLDDRISIEGPHFYLKSSAAQNIGMAMHEMATNAGKYGALSNDHGRIAINWALEKGDDDAQALTIAWTERNGPSVVAPKKNGFGSAVFGKMLEHGLSASVSYDFHKDGFVWEMSCPADFISVRDNDPTAT